MDEALLPLRQGKLDRLCGLYALLNTYQLLVPQDSWDTSQRQLFKASVEWLNCKDLLRLAVTSGLEVEHLLGMIDDVFKPAFRFIEVDQLWKKKRILGKNGLNQILEYVAPPSSTVLVCYKYEHWTVFQKYDETKIYLYDSEGRGYVNLPLSEGVFFDPRNILVFRNTNLS